uniref:Uncharacterized protein n=1 Tax=Onchocerca volvulus TaxID=6282 RepID=A0A8R1U1N3_ONCVO
MTEEMIAHFMEQSICKQREIRKQIDNLKNNQIKKSIDEDEQYEACPDSDDSSEDRGDKK